MLYKYNDKLVTKRLKFDGAFCSKKSIPISKLVIHFTHKGLNFVFHKCPAYTSCQFEGLRAEYDEHIMSCQYIEVECNKGNNDIMRKDIDTHSGLDVTKVVYEEGKRKITAVKEKIRYKENEHNLIRQMINSIINEVKLHNDNIRLYIKKLDRIQEIRLTERGRSTYSPINTKGSICKNSVSYTKCIKGSKFICNGVEGKKFCARCMLIDNKSDYTRAMCSLGIKRGSKGHFETCTNGSGFGLKNGKI